jgi:hypothetical protein
LHDMMQSDLSTIDQFLNSINLSMSVKKTQFMIFRTVNSSSVNVFDKIYFNDKCISLVTEFKYLGIIIDHYLNWKKHVNYIASKVAPFVGLIGRIRFVTNRSVLMNLYYAHIHSRLTYCLPVWSGCSLELKMRLQRLQNKVIKFIKFKHRLTSTSSLYDNKFLSFLNVCDYEAVLFIHKINTGLVKSDFTLSSNSSTITRITRQSNLIRLPQFLMAKSQSSCFYRGARKYNDFIRCNNFDKSKQLALIKKSIKKFVFTSNSNA